MMLMVEQMRVTFCNNFNAPTNNDNVTRSAWNAAAFFLKLVRIIMFLIVHYNVFFILLVILAQSLILVLANILLYISTYNYLGLFVLKINNQQ
jgi:hypothetical protein